MYGIPCLASPRPLQVFDSAITSLAHSIRRRFDCRKISGSTYSTNMIIQEDGFKVLSGNAKPISKTADGSNIIMSHFCGDCGSTMWRDGPSFQVLIIKVGTLDDVDALAKAKPTVELFAPTRVDWVNEIPGAAQKQTMS